MVLVVTTMTAFAEWKPAGWGKKDYTPPSTNVGAIIAKSAEPARQMVTWSTRLATITNKVEKGEYDKRTNGYMWVENAETFPRTIPHAEVKDWVGTLNQWNSICLVTNMCFNGTWVSINQAAVNAPDPFEEKVTVTMNVVLDVKEYIIHVGPLDSKYCTQYTVTKRWRDIRRQKISQTDVTEIKQD